MEKKKILILGGGQAQIELIKTAKSLGIFTIVVGKEGDYPGYKLADKVYNTDIFDKSAILNIAKEEAIDGIAVVCSDFGLVTLGYVNDSLNLQGLSEKSALDSSNKYFMKQTLKSANVNTSKFMTVRNEDDVLKASSEFNYPLIVKAVDLQGSKGIYICYSEEDLLLNYKKSISESRVDYCIVEEFIQGEEFGAQAFVYEGEVIFVLLHGDILNKMGTSNVPIGHYVPYDCSETFKNEVVDIVKKSIKALNFNNTAVNVDLIVKDGVPYIIELTGRAGANFLPEITSEYLGLNYYQMVITCAVGDSPKEYFNTRCSGSNAVVARMLYSTEAGVLNNLEYDSSNVKIVDFFVSKGDLINKFTNSRDCIGRIMCVGNTIADCNDRIDKFVNNLTIELN